MLIKSTVAAAFVATVTSEGCSDSCGYGSMCYVTDEWLSSKYTEYLEGCETCQRVGQFMQPFTDCEWFAFQGMDGMYQECLNNCPDGKDTFPTAAPTTVPVQEECWGKVMPDQSCGYGSACFGPNGWNNTMTEWEGCMTCEETGVFSINDCMILLETGFEDEYHGCMINCFGNDDPQPTHTVHTTETTASADGNLHATFEDIYHYQIILDNASDFMEFRFQAPEFTNDIHLGFSATTGHDDRKWEIVIGGWGGTRSVIRTENQTPHLGVAEVVHSRQVYDELRNDFFVKVQDGRIAIHHSDDGQMGEVFMEYKSMDIVKAELPFLLASGGFGGRGQMNIEPNDDVVDDVHIIDDYNYQILYENACHYDSFWFEAPNFTNDIHIGISAFTGHEEKKWEIVIGGWGGTMSVIRTDNQTPYPGLIEVPHDRAVYDELRNRFNFQVQDGKITIRDANGNVFMEHRDQSIVKKNLPFLLFTGGFGGRGDVNVIPVDVNFMCERVNDVNTMFNNFLPIQFDAILSNERDSFSRRPGRLTPGVQMRQRQFRGWMNTLFDNMFKHVNKNRNRDCYIEAGKLQSLNMELSSQFNQCDLAHANTIDTFYDGMVGFINWFYSECGKKEKLMSKFNHTWNKINRIRAKIANDQLPV